MVSRDVSYCRPGFNHIALQNAVFSLKSHPCPTLKLDEGLKGFIIQGSINDYIDEML